MNQGFVLQKVVEKNFLLKRKEDVNQDLLVQTLDQEIQKLVVTHVQEPTKNIIKKKKLIK